MARDKKPSSRRCPYDVLNLPAKARATGEEIRKAYHRLARVHHPDKARTDDERERATIAFKDIGAAYELLSDPAARAKYDREGHAPEPMDPREAEAEERHARRMYCAAMGIPETGACCASSSRALCFVFHPSVPSVSTFDRVPFQLTDGTSCRARASAAFFDSRPRVLVHARGAVRRDDAEGGRDGRDAERRRGVRPGERGEGVQRADSAGVEGRPRDSIRRAAHE
jgi:curved DNA-binding protein CbpA